MQYMFLRVPRFNAEGSLKAASDRLPGCPAVARPDDGKTDLQPVSGNVRRTDSRGQAALLTDAEIAKAQAIVAQAPAIDY